ncbi:hypothetical protein [Streptomyces sp. NBC_01314]|uniref:hypothetical protein n=1 Tax=Streptomyces sp. NBC_01314 TaxID=2903821 RepID=UPI003093C6C9|nr:hypothetical protein OG622_13120 [Streptomyces sp. NBC_01314]
MGLGLTDRRRAEITTIVGRKPVKGFRQAGSRSRVGSWAALGILADRSDAVRREGP